MLRHQRFINLPCHYFNVKTYMNIVLLYINRIVSNEPFQPFTQNLRKIYVISTHVDCLLSSMVIGVAYTLKSRQSNNFEIKNMTTIETVLNYSLKSRTKACE